MYVLCMFDMWDIVLSAYLLKRPLSAISSPKILNTISPSLINFIQFFNINREQIETKLFKEDLSWIVVVSFVRSLVCAPALVCNRTRDIHKMSTNVRVSQFTNDQIMLPSNCLKKFHQVLLFTEKYTSCSLKHVRPIHKEKYVSYRELKVFSHHWIVSWIYFVFFWRITKNSRHKGKAIIIRGHK